MMERQTRRSNPVHHDVAQFKRHRRVRHTGLTGVPLEPPT